MKTILITGLAGFVGSHLTDLLLQDPEVQIAGIIHPSHQVVYLEANPRVTIYREDILKASRLKSLVRKIKPDAVYHLAGMAHVHESWSQRKETINTNFIGSFYLLEACRALSEFPRVLLIGSAECYGNVPESEQPIQEDRLLSPSSPYAVSKIAQEMLGIQYARGEKLPVYLSRSFNHTGPRQKHTFVCSAFARQIAEAEEQTGTGKIFVGNLIARRDFSDVRDVVRAYKSILDHGKPGEPYNVCSGKAVSIEEILQMLISVSERKFEVIPDSTKFRPVDMPLLLGSHGKLTHDSGWKPSFDIRTTLSDLLNYWRSKVKTETPVL